MLSWSNKKTLIVALVAGTVISLFGIFSSWWSTALLGGVITVTIVWIVEEINDLRKIHGISIGELEERVEELEKKVKKN